MCVGKVDNTSLPRPSNRGRSGCMSLSSPEPCEVPPYIPLPLSRCNVPPTNCRVLRISCFRLRKRDSEPASSSGLDSSSGTTDTSTNPGHDSVPVSRGASNAVVTSDRKGRWLNECLGTRLLVVALPRRKLFCSGTGCYSRLRAPP